MKINPKDNVEVNISTGHKAALCDIKKGEQVIKYGFPIGVATRDIKNGEAVHTDNLKTGLSEILEYEYAPKFNQIDKVDKIPTFKGYRRENGEVGIRNEVWIVNTVGCVNKTAKIIAEITGTFHFEHPYGCSQLGDDHKVTQKILKGLINHPNAAGVLVVGLGCENNNIDLFKKELGEINEKRVKFLNCQSVSDEIAEGIKLVGELKKYARTFKREDIPVSELKIGLKCGGSDGLSGITANPLVGEVSDMLISMGGTSVLTEVPEMFGAETILFERCETKEVFEKAVDMINNFKKYYISYNQPVYENPSPGNKAGGITTLEEKSLGCVQKGGSGTVTDVLELGDMLKKKGLNLLTGPGNDIVACTNLTAAGAHMILFTTGRGTPLGAPVPTVKISTNDKLNENKPHWIDFNAGAKLNDSKLKNKLFDYIVKVASGKKTNNEKNGYREIAIFKNGVTL